MLAVSCARVKYRHVAVFSTGMVLVCWVCALATTSAAGNGAGAYGHAGFLVAMLRRNDTLWCVGSPDTIAS